jgi:hypothetical protein
MTTTCLIEMSRIRTLTGLSRGELIVARVRARNENGWDSYSQQNVQGALIETEPDQITDFTYDITQSSNS